MTLSNKLNAVRIGRGEFSNASYFCVAAFIIFHIVGAAYLGTQGDIWDAQKDMTAAIVGGILATMAIRAVWRRRGQKSN